jgi:nicotinamidase-related amidase
MTRKPRCTGFAATALRRRRVGTRLVCGVATHACVERTIRDACCQAGPGYVPPATMYNVVQSFGWAASTGDIACTLRNAEETA